MSDNGHVNFASGLDIGSECKVFQAVQANLIDTARPAGCANIGAVLSFDGSVGLEETEDVIDCLLLSQLSADRKGSRFEAYPDWSRQFGSVLSNLGWVTQSVSRSQIGDNKKFNIIDWMSETTVPPEFDTLHLWLIERVRRLANLMRGEALLEYLDKNARSTTSMVLIEAVAIQSSANIVDVHVITYRVITTMPLRNLFDRMSTEFGDQFELARERFVLDVGAFSAIRQNVRDKVRTAPKEKQPIVLT